MPSEQTPELVKGEPITPPYDQLRSLLERLREAQTRADERAMATHQRFNVFTTLLEPHDEVRLHTRFLHCLLNPEGLHDCGARFLKLFIATLKERPTLDDEGQPVRIDVPDPDESWKAEKEFSIPDVGQIDILLKHGKCGIAIENKPNPDQHEDQIKRYDVWLSGQFDSRHVIYLTLHGGQSKTHHGRPYLRISYADHILVWLEKCLRETYDIIPINQALVQYRAVVRGLTGKYLDPYMKSIAEFIAQNPDLIRYRQQIIQGIDAARAEFLDELATKIAAELEKHGFAASPHARPTVKYVMPPSHSVLHDAPFKIWIEYDDKYTRSLSIQIVREKFDYKICKENDKSPQDVPSGLFERMKEQMIRSFHGDDRYDPAEVFGDMCPTGIYKLIKVGDDECLAESLKTKTKGKAAADVCDRIVQYIRILEKAYEASRQTNTKL